MGRKRKPTKKPYQRPPDKDYQAIDQQEREERDRLNARIQAMIVDFLARHPRQHDLTVGENPVETVAMDQVNEYLAGMEQALMDEQRREQEGEPEQPGRRKTKRKAPDDHYYLPIANETTIPVRGKKRQAEEESPESPPKRTRSNGRDPPMGRPVRRRTFNDITREMEMRRQQQTNPPAPTYNPTLAGNDHALAWLLGNDEDGATASGPSASRPIAQARADQASTEQGLVVILPVSANALRNLLQQIGNGGTTQPNSTLQPAISLPAVNPPTNTAPTTAPAMRRVIIRPPRPPPAAPAQTAAPAQPATPASSTGGRGRGNRDPNGHLMNLWNWEEEVRILETYDIIITQATADSHNAWMATHRPGVVRTLPGLRQHAAILRGRNPNAARMRREQKSWSQIMKEDADAAKQAARKKDGKK